MAIRCVIAFGCREWVMMKLQEVLKRTEDFFLTGTDPDGKFFFRARLLVQFELFSVLFTVGYWIVSQYTGFFMIERLMVIGFVVFVSQLFALRYGVARHTVAHTFVAFCWAVIVVLSMCSGGIASPVLPWATWVPVVALLLMGRKVGWSWGVIGLATLLFFFFTDGKVFVPDSWRVSPGSLLTVSLFVGLLGMLLFITSVFHIMGKRLLKTIKGQTAIIEKQNNEIALRNENLEAEVEKRTRELLDYNHQLQQFAFIASHNLRAPVASLLGLGNLLEVKPLPDADREQINRNMIVTARELDRVVRDLSTIQEMRKSSSELFSVIDLAEEVNHICVSLERELTESGSQLESDFSAAPLIHSVRPLFDSIMMNLISNAVKYRHPERPPHIRIRSEKREGEVCLTVADNGLGMELEVYGDKLFSLYGRFHSHVDGKGLGLYLVKTHVQALGGRIEVRSEAGKGTTFLVFFKE